MRIDKIIVVVSGLPKVIMLLEHCLFTAME